MVSQFQAQAQVQESIAASSTLTATVSEHGLMAITSTSGTEILFPSTNMRIVISLSKIIHFLPYKSFYHMMLGF